MDLKTLGNQDERELSSSAFVKAFHWIVGILQEEEIPFQIVGGLAARAYGATRPLADIDFYISEDDLEKLLPRVEEYIVRPPKHHLGESWDLIYFALDYQGQKIEFGLAETTKLFDAKQNTWVSAAVDFSNATQCEIEGVIVPVISKDELIRYKTILSRDVDLQDIQEISKSV